MNTVRQGKVKQFRRGMMKSEENRIEEKRNKFKKMLITRWLKNLKRKNLEINIEIHNNEDG